jgi:hypothetical protein
MELVKLNGKPLIWAFLGLAFMFLPALVEVGAA